MGFDQRELMEAALQEYFPNDPHEIIKDINGKDRMLFIYRNFDNHRKVLLLYNEIKVGYDDH